MDKQTTCPCWHCERDIKCPTCHIICIEYKAWKTAHEDRCQRDLAQRMAVSRLIDQTGDAVQKANTRHGGRNNRK